MSNTFGSNLGVNYDLMPRIFGAPLQVLREECALLRTANKDFAAAAGQIGDVATYAVTNTTSTTTVTPAMIPPTPTAMQVLTKNVSITEWISSVPFGLTTREIQQYQLNGVVPAQIKQAYRAIARAINQKLFAKYYRIYGFAGVGGTGAFASTSNVLATLTRKLQNQLCPDSPDVHLFLSLKDTEAIRVLDTYMKNPQLAQRPENVETSKLANYMGFNLFRDRDVPVHTAGSVTAGHVTVTSNLLAGAVSTTVPDASDIGVTTDGSGTVALKAGDVIVLPTVTATYTPSMQTYVVQADVTIGTSDTGTITVCPRLQANVASGTYVETPTVAGGHDATFATGLNNIACQPEAFGMIARLSKPEVAPPEGASGGFMGQTLGEHMYVVDDGEGGTGLPLKVSYYPGYEMGMFQISLLFGCDLVDPRLACRLLSYTAA